MIFRPYQSECVDAVLRDFASHRSVLAVLATGLGKTVIGSALILEWLRESGRGQVLWIAHRKELIEQAVDTIHQVTGLDVAVEMGQHCADLNNLWSSPVVVGSVQTLSRDRRLRRFRPERFGLLVTDEAHHAVASTYRKVYRHFREGNPEWEIVGNTAIRHLGITATPKRSDDLAMGRVFDHVAFSYEIEPAVRDGWLVPVRQAIVMVEDLDLSKIRTIGGDYQQDELEEVVTRRKVLLQMAQPAIEQSGEKPALFFCVGVKQSEMMCEVLRDRKPGSAAWVSGETEKSERKQIIEDFRAGRLQYLCNCGVLLEGFDAPIASTVVMARPTKSLPLYVQMLGRATRPLPGTVEGLADAAARKTAIAHSAKPWATVLDFVGNATLHAHSATVSAADVLGGNYGDAVKQYAKRNLQSNGNPVGVEESLERADAEVALLLEEQDRRARIVAEVDYRVRYLDRPESGPVREQQAGRRGEPATAKQVWKLIHLGVSRLTAEGYTKRQASAVIDKLLRKRGEAVA